MSRFVLTSAAMADLEEISEYIGRDNPSAARRVRARLRNKMRELAQVPETGHRRTDLTEEPLKFFSVYSYLIAYDPNTSPLQVIRVLHGARDVKSILED